MSEAEKAVPNRGLFTPGNNIGRLALGVKKTTRRELSINLITALSADFDKHGEEAIRQCRVGEPTNYLRIIASIVPKELEITTQPTEGMKPDELATAIGILKELLAQSATIDPQDTIVGIAAPTIEAQD